MRCSMRWRCPNAGGSSCGTISGGRKHSTRCSRGSPRASARTATAQPRRLPQASPGSPPERAEELVGAYLDQRGLPLSGNRSLGEITARLLDHAADLRAEPLPREVATVIDYYLAVSAPPKEAAERIAMIAKGAGLDLGPALYASYAPLRAPGEKRHRSQSGDFRHRVRPQPGILLRPGVPDRSRR